MKTQVMIVLAGFFVVAAAGSEQLPDAEKPASTERPPAKLSPAENRRAAEALAEIIRTQYVLEDVAIRSAEELLQRTHDGAFDEPRTPKQLAELLNAAVREITGDGHMAVRYEPDFNVEDDYTPKPETGRIHNFGVREAKRMDGNIGYLRFSGFHFPEVGVEPFAAATTLLANTDVVILDLRENGGGSSLMSQIVMSYFLGSEPTQISSMWRRTPEFEKQRWTLPVLPGRRLDRQALYVLVSEATFSAAESVAYDLQALGRATIVGERTGGGAHKIDYPSFYPGYRVQMSVQRVINPVTGTNFEQVGVKPDIVCPPSEALDRAVLAAIELRLPIETDETIRIELRWARDEANARLHPIGLSDEHRSGLVGAYGRERIILRNGVLWCQRDDLDPWRMEVMAADSFRFPEVTNYRVRFERDETDGKVLRLIGKYLSGTEVVRERDN